MWEITEGLTHFYEYKKSRFPLERSRSQPRDNTVSRRLGSFCAFLCVGIMELNSTKQNSFKLGVVVFLQHAHRIHIHTHAFRTIYCRMHHASHRTHRTVVLATRTYPHIGRLFCDTRFLYPSFLCTRTNNYQLSWAQSLYIDFSRKRKQKTNPGKCMHTCPPLGYWMKEGLGFVVHFPLGCVAKINTPWPWPWPWPWHDDTPGALQKNNIWAVFLSWDAFAVGLSLTGWSNSACYDRILVKCMLHSISRGCSCHVHIPSGCVAKINVPWPWPWPWPWYACLQLLVELRTLEGNRLRAASRWAAGKTKLPINVFWPWPWLWPWLYLQRGPPIAENGTTTHRTHRTHRLWPWV